jgi:hypothetical protein
MAEERDIESPCLRLIIPLHRANESINLLNAPVHTNECGSRVAIRHVQFSKLKRVRQK